MRERIFPAMLNGQKNVLHTDGLFHVMCKIGTCFLLLRMNRALPHCLGILHFVVVIISL